VDSSSPNPHPVALWIRKIVPFPQWALAMATPPLCSVAITSFRGPGPPPPLRTHAAAPAPLCTLRGSSDHPAWQRHPPSLNCAEGSVRRGIDGQLRGALAMGNRTRCGGERGEINWRRVLGISPERLWLGGAGSSDFPILTFPNFGSLTGGPGGPRCGGSACQ
jgi:hypothetical protein